MCHISGLNICLKKQSTSECFFLAQNRVACTSQVYKPDQRATLCEGGWTCRVLGFSSFLSFPVTTCISQGTQGTSVQTWSPHIQYNPTGLVPLSWLFQAYWAASGVCSVDGDGRAVLCAGVTGKSSSIMTQSETHQKGCLVWGLVDYQACVFFWYQNHM